MQHASISTCPFYMTKRNTIARISETKQPILLNPNFLFIPRLFYAYHCYVLYMEDFLQKFQSLLCQLATCGVELMLWMTGALWLGATKCESLKVVMGRHDTFKSKEASLLQILVLIIFSGLFLKVLYFFLEWKKTFAYSASSCCHLNTKTILNLHRMWI